MPFYRIPRYDMTSTRSVGNVTVFDLSHHPATRIGHYRDIEIGCVPDGDVPISAAAEAYGRQRGKSIPRR